MSLKSLMKSLKTWSIIKFRVIQVIEVVCVNRHAVQLDPHRNSLVGLSVFAFAAHGALKWSSQIRLSKRRVSLFDLRMPPKPTQTVMNATFEKISHL